MRINTATRRTDDFKIVALVCAILWTCTLRPLASADKMLNGSGVKIFTGTLAVVVDAEVLIAHDEQAPAIQSWRRSSLGGMRPGHRRSTHPE